MRHMLITAYAPSHQAAKLLCVAKWVPGHWLNECLVTKAPCVPDKTSYDTHKLQLAHALLQLPQVCVRATSVRKGTDAQYKHV